MVGAAAVAGLLVAACGGGTHRVGRPEPGRRLPDQQRGFALPAWNVDDYDSPAAPAYLKAIAATGARWVQINPTWYQDRADDPAMHRTDQTASDASVRSIIARAHGQGLKVLLKPHVDLPGDQDRATIRPRDSQGWFRSYTAMLAHYAELAGQTGVAELAVGTELAGVSGDRAGWLGVVRAVRAVYRGKLVYAANYDEYRHVAFWDALDLIGVDAYWPLSDAPTTDEYALERSWKPIAASLAAFAAREHRRVLFTEAGYVSQRGTTTAPYSWTVSKSPAPGEQAAAYRALLAEFSGSPWWAGVFWWMWDDWPESGETPAALAYTPHGKPAEGVIRRWWLG
jgi:hypothetical protein